MCIKLVRTFGMFTTVCSISSHGTFCLKSFVERERDPDLNEKKRLSKNPGWGLHIFLHRQ